MVGMVASHLTDCGLIKVYSLPTPTPTHLLDEFLLFIRIRSLHQTGTKQWSSRDSVWSLSYSKSIQVYTSGVH